MIPIKHPLNLPEVCLANPTSPRGDRPSPLHGDRCNQDLSLGQGTGHRSGQPCRTGALAIGERSIAAAQHFFRTPMFEAAKLED